MSLFEISDDVFVHVVATFMTFDDKIIMMMVCTRIRKMFLKYSFENEEELMIAKLIIGDYDNDEFEKILSHFKSMIDIRPQLFLYSIYYIYKFEINDEIMKLIIKYYKECGKILIELINTIKGRLYGSIMRKIKSVTEDNKISYYNILEYIIKNAEPWVANRIINEECIHTVRNCRGFKSCIDDTEMFKKFIYAYLSRNIIYNRDENSSFDKLNDFDILVKLKYCGINCLPKYNFIICHTISSYIEKYIKLQSIDKQNILNKRCFKIYHEMKFDDQNTMDTYNDMIAENPDMILQNQNL